MILVLICSLLVGNARAVNLTVVGINKDGSSTPLNSYRWLVEEDKTYHVVPGVSDPKTLAVSFHRSYMPVVSKGDESAPLSAVALDPTKHYYVSVIPKALGAYTIGGARITPGQTEVTVELNQLPLPTAQIAVFVFADNAPINNAPDLPEEAGLSGFRITVEDAGGKYGASAGAQMTDVYGNLLGTVYDETCDASGANPGAGSSPCIDPVSATPICEEDPNVPGSCLVESLITGADGRITIKNLAPGKYGIQAVPPPGTSYQQTSTIEGTKVVDAWVKANEPPFFAEFGPPGPHVFFGFVEPFNRIPAGGTTTISGQVVNLHTSRPPYTAFYNGAPFAHTTPWIGLNDNAGLAGGSQGIYAARAAADGSFAIPSVPPGEYQLAVWDDNLDVVFAFHNVTINENGSCVTPDGTCDLGEVPVFQWFTRLEHHVFNDINQDGRRDVGEGPLPEQAVNLRFRDGTLYQSFPTDSEGFVPFDQVFPFFSWQVAEVDFARFKATGITVTVDDGGPVAYGEQLTPQIQGVPLDPSSDTSAGTSRTEVGPVLTQAFQGFMGQTSVIEWGKTAYQPGENGGISGIVYYAVTRAEDNPAQAAVEPWEPGIPRVQVALYQDSNGDGVPDDRNGNGRVNLADIDNYPFQWAPMYQYLDDGVTPNPDWTGLKGPEDVNRIGAANSDVFNIGDAINLTTTDSWDDSLPENCQYGINAGSGIDDPFVFRGEPTDCYDGMRNWNQVRPGVFDGGYAFTNYYPRPSDGRPVAPWANAGIETPLPMGVYIVEASMPPGYSLAKEEDRNVDFGDTYTPTVNLLAPLCVGEDHLVPPELTLFPGVEVGSGYGGTTRPLCDRKQVFLSDRSNAAADFFFFTEVPIAGHIIGFILDDTANEWDPNSPQFGEKYAPPFLPISIRDYTGREIDRVYSDEYGVYNALVPSTYTTNLPAPSGMSPNMLTTCMNDPVRQDGTLDPQFNPQYSTFCYTFQYMPGSTTYLDTPVVPVAAMAGPNQEQLDCEQPDGTPGISLVSGINNGVGGGPYDPDFNGLVIDSLGQVAVPNPAYDGVGGTEPKTILRDYRFGTATGQVLLDGFPIPVSSWGEEQITTGSIPPPLAGAKQLEIVRADGSRSVTAVTVQIGPLSGNNQVHTVQAGGSIQTAINNASGGDLILVAPGIYDEMVVMWKPVQLQGWGAAATIISAINAPAEKLQNWRQQVEQLVTDGEIDLLPGQEVAVAGFEPALLFTEEGAGIIVLSKASGPNQFNANRAARIDGLTVKGASTGGGIMVNGYADYLNISNNNILNNSGFFGGGIRIGHPQLVAETPNGDTFYQDADNDNIRIHHNQITRNGGLGGSGGGVSINTGSDNYEIADNYICGNFSMGDGGGIGHLGLSDAGLIKANTIIFNETFNQGITVSGGGISIAGQAPLAGATMSDGSGSVLIDGNVIQGNLAGAGDGGGIQSSRVNGQDVLNNNVNRWHELEIINNNIVNNIAALAGGGVSMLDTANSVVAHNTIAHNDSTATAGNAFTPADPNQSVPQPAGFASRAHSTELNSAIIDSGVTGRRSADFSKPLLRDNIIWHNRSFYFSGDPNVFPPVYRLLPDLAAGDAPVYDDLGVLGTNGNLTPRYNLFSAETSDHGAANATNIKTDADGFVAAYLNSAPGNTVRPGEATTALFTTAAFDEGGNFIQVRFGPLTPTGDYHLAPGAEAINAGTTASGNVLGSGFDIDEEQRPAPGDTCTARLGCVDIGSDEQQ